MPLKAKTDYFVIASVHTIRTRYSAAPCTEMDWGIECVVRTVASGVNLEVTTRHGRLSHKVSSSLDFRNMVGTPWRLTFLVTNRLEPL